MSRAERRRRRHRRRRGLVILVALLALTAGAVYEVRGLATDHGPRIPPGRPVTFVVTEGESTQEIADALERAGVVDSAVRFRRDAEDRGLDQQLKPGTYPLTTGMDPAAVVELLATGSPLGVQFTIPEGFTVAQIVDRIAGTHRFSRQQLERALRDRSLVSDYRPRGKPLEGLLFPQTYRIQTGDTPVTVLQAMLDQLGAQLGGVDLSDNPAHLDPYQVLVVASMIEREARVDEDRPRIARVIYNRLARHMPLQIDATVLYALGNRKAKLSDQDLRVNSPFNTYLHAGLPPTPICSPGMKSIQAALQPSDGNWLYYVLVSADGHHAFTADPREFARLKAAAKAKGLL
jgi:UPF0755 protein